MSEELEPIASEPLISPEAPAGDLPPVEPASASPALDYAEIEARAYAATQRAIADAQAANQAPPRVHAPEVGAVDALDLREDMLEEAMEMCGELPAEARREVRQQLRQFKTVESLQQAKAAGLHKILADAALGKSVREGKHVPKSAGALAVSREPVHSEPSVKIPDAYRREQEEVAALLGVKFSEEELREAYLSR